MKYSAFHLNLLKDGEKLSSSPIRLRVMVPTVAFFACLAMVVWWGVIFTQLMLVKSQAQAVDDDLKAKSKAHVDVIDKMNLVREYKLQLEQLEYYSNAVRHVASPLAMLADVMPLKVQLTELVIQPPPPQNLVALGKRGKPLFGPTNNVETQVLTLAGKTTKETPVQALMDSLAEPGFEALVTRDRKINSFRQDTGGPDGRRLLTFELEYRMPERRFAK